MGLKEHLCAECGTVIQYADRIGYRMSCPSCGGDLHSCLNCQHYDRSIANECREPQADRVREKDRANYCDQFVTVETSKSGLSQSQIRPSSGDLRAQAEALFRKKT